MKIASIECSLSALWISRYELKVITFDTFATFIIYSNIVASITPIVVILSNDVIIILSSTSEPFLDKFSRYLLRLADIGYLRVLPSHLYSNESLVSLASVSFVVFE